MSLKIPTTQEQADANLANIESRINQTTPLNDKAFSRVVAIMEALQYTSLYKYGVERALQNLALTASGSDLDLIGNEYGVIRKPAEAAVLTVSLPAVDSTVIPSGTDFIGVPNGVRYFSNAQAIASGGSADFDVTAEDVGVIGNLQVSDTMSIATQIAGAETIATVTAIVNIGADEETDDAYRLRVLDEIRTEGGGSNAADYRSWSQEVAGVTRAYPYSGNPADLGSIFWDLITAFYDSVSFSIATEDTGPQGIAFKSDGSKMYMVGNDNDEVYQYTLSTPWDLSTASYDSVSFSIAGEDTGSAGIAFKSDGSKMYMVGFTNDKIYQYILNAPSVPPERTVYIEADTSIEPDGIAPQSLLDEVRDSITTDPVTGLARQALGMTDETLFVESISRTGIFVTISNLTVDASLLAETQAAISEALTIHFLSLNPFVDGLDADIDRNDKITDLTISTVVQDVLDTFNASALGVAFGTVPGVFLGEYILLPGEKTKRDIVAYV